MPKIKSHSASKKRFALTKNGLVKRAKMNRRHILTKKSTKRKRQLRGAAYADKHCVDDPLRISDRENCQERKPNLEVTDYGSCKGRYGNP